MHVIPYSLAAITPGRAAFDDASEVLLVSAERALERAWDAEGPSTLRAAAVELSTSAAALVALANPDGDEELRRLDRIDRSLANGYKANNGNVSGRYLEYVDITTMRADVRYLLDRVRAISGAHAPSRPITTNAERIP